VRRFRILFISPFSIFPPHFGGSDRAYNLVKGLAQVYDVTILHTDYAQVKTHRPQDEEIPHVRVIKVGPPHRLAQVFNLLLMLKGLQLILAHRPDVMICEVFWSGLHTMFLHYTTGIPYIFDDLNAEYVRYQRMKRSACGFVRWAEAVCAKSADQVFCVSEVDKDFLIELGIEGDKIAVVPNGIDMDQYRPNPAARLAVRRELGIADDEPMALFFGKLDYQPNAEAVEVLYQEIMPRVLAQNPAVRFVVAGYNPPRIQYAHPNLTFPGFVPRIEDYINASDVVVVPLTSGGGTKFKVVQSIACGKPVVTTSIGAEGIREADMAMVVADDWDEFARLTLAILADGWEIPSTALKSFRHEYSWQRMAEQAIEAIDRRLRAFSAT